MYKAFLEAPWKARAAAICFILAKFMFVCTALCMLIGDTATIVAISIYSFLVFLSVVLCLAEGFSKKKSYKDLQEEIESLKAALKESDNEKKS